jgi:hypothetical protein
MANRIHYGVPAIAARLRDQHIWRLPLAPQSAPCLFGFGLLPEAKA